MIDDMILPNVSANGGVLTCDATVVTLSVITDGSIFEWTGPNGFISNEAAPEVSATGTYAVTVSFVNGCSATASALVTADKTLPSVSVTGGTITCQQPSISLGVATNGNVIGWTGPDGFTSSQINPNVNIAGTYTVTVRSLNGCMNTASTVVINDSDAPSVEASVSGIIDCEGTGVTLSAITNGRIENWTGPNGFATNSAAPIVSIPGIYTVLVEGDNGCITTADVEVNQGGLCTRNFFDKKNKRNRY